MIKIICPKCNAEARLSLVDTDYSGPRRCWKCHEAFTITIQNNKLTSCEPLSKEDFEKWQEEKKAADKAHAQGFSYAKREEPETRQAPLSKQDFIRPGSFNFPGQPSAPADPAKPAAKTPPERFNTFVPLQDIPKEPEKKPQKPKDPPDRFNIFIPPQT